MKLVVRQANFAWLKNFAWLAWRAKCATLTRQSFFGGLLGICCLIKPQFSPGAAKPRQVKTGVLPGFYFIQRFALIYSVSQLDEVRGAGAMPLLGGEAPKPPVPHLSKNRYRTRVFVVCRGGRGAQQKNSSTPPVKAR
jgi:hypothetical protein